MSNIIFTGTVTGTFSVDQDGTARITFGETVISPPPPPPPPPPPTTGGYDYDWDIDGGVSFGPKDHITIPLNQSIAVRFKISNPDLFPNKVWIGLQDQFAGKPLTIAVSTQPHDFSGQTVTGVFEIGIGCAWKPNQFNMFILTPGQYYFLNVKATNSGDLGTFQYLYRG